MNIREFAKITGCSHTTVSRALNDSPLVKQSTKDEIQRQAKALGFIIDANAKSLATGIRNTIGILYPYSNLRKIGSLYTSEVIESIRMSFNEYHLDAIISGYDSIGENLHSLTRLIREKKVDAIVVLGYEVTDIVIDELSKFTKNILLVNPDPTVPFDRCSAIVIDNRAGGELAYTALKDIASEELLIISHDRPQYTDRVKGFIDSASNNVRVVQFPDVSYETSYTSTLAMKDEISSYKGIFAVTDIMALGAMNALQDMGYQIGKDISIVGYDDIEWTRYSRPNLTTIRQPRTLVAKNVAQIIQKMVLEKKEFVEHIQLSPTLVKRQSTYERESN